MRISGWYVAHGFVVSMYVKILHPNYVKLARVAAGRKLGEKPL
jgi:hypothetical protein